MPPTQSLAEAIESSIGILLKGFKRIDTEAEINGSVTEISIYWAGKIIRIDIKGVENK